MPEDFTWLREVVTEMRALGVVEYAGVTLGPAPRPPIDESSTALETPAETMAAKKRRLFTAAAK